jgi:hypothetical protein
VGFPDFISKFKNIVFRIMSTFYKIIFSIQTITIWLLFRKLGYFEHGGLDSREKRFFSRSQRAKGDSADTL